MAPTPQPISFHHIHNMEIRIILSEALGDMAKLLHDTPCDQAADAAEILNERKKQAFTLLYTIGRETMERETSEEVLKAIRILQDAFARIIQAVSAMADVTHELSQTWLMELADTESKTAE